MEDKDLALIHFKAVVLITIYPIYTNAMQLSALECVGDLLYVTELERG